MQGTTPELRCGWSSGSRADGEECIETSDCADSLNCNEYIDDTGDWYKACGLMDDPNRWRKPVGEECIVSIADDCADGLTCLESEGELNEYGLQLMTCQEMDDPNYL